MPVYAYTCTACDHQFEQRQSFSDPALQICPECEGALRKVFNSVGIVFKGSGFYRNDSRDTGRNGAGAGRGERKTDSGAPDSGAPDAGSSQRGASESGSNGSAGASESGAATNGGGASSGKNGAASGSSGSNSGRGSDSSPAAASPTAASSGR